MVMDVLDMVVILAMLDMLLAMLPLFIMVMASPMLPTLQVLSMLPSARLTHNLLRPHSPQSNSTLATLFSTQLAIKMKAEQSQSNTRG